MTTKLKTYILSSLLLLSIPAAAQQLPEIDTDRPDQTESSSVLPVSTFQIEAGLHTEGWQAEAIHTLPATLFRYGALEWLELRAILEYDRFAYTDESIVEAQQLDRSSYGVGAKFQLARESGPVPEIALLVHLIGNSRSSTLVPDFRFSMGHSLPGDLSLGYNLGGEWDSGRDKMIGVYTLALGFPLGSELGGYVELFGDYDESLASSFDAGITWAPQNNLQLDLSGGTGISPGTPDFFLGIGVSYRLPR